MREALECVKGDILQIENNDKVELDHGTGMILGCARQRCIEALRSDHEEKYVQELCLNCSAELGKCKPSCPWYPKGRLHPPEGETP